MSDVELRSLSEDSEDAPLISLDEIEQPEDKSIPRPSSLWKNGPLRTLGLALLVSTLYVFNDIAKYVASLRLISQGICREYYLENDPAAINNGKNITEEICASPIIQQRVARISGYMLSLDAFLAFLLTIPYGLMLDRLSEPLLASMNIVGFLLSSAWLATICFNWVIFPTWMVILAPFFSIIGGGSAVFDSVISVIVARNVSNDQLSLCFSIFLAAGLFTQIICLSITSSLLESGKLFTPLMLTFPVGLASLITLSLMRPSGQAHGIRTGMGRINYITLRIEIRSTLAALAQLVSNPQGLGLLVAVPLAKIADSTAEVALLYVQKKFDTSFAYASRVLTLQTVEGLILLVAILPLVKHILQTRLRIPSGRVDLSITRVGFLCMAAGCLIMGVSQVWAAYISGLVILTLGWGTGPALRSVLTDMTNPEKIAALYTVIALGESMGFAVGALILNRSYALAIGWDNRRYLGLPFLVATFCLLLGGVGSLLGKCCGRSRLG